MLNVFFNIFYFIQIKVSYATQILKALEKYFRILTYDWNWLTRLIQSGISHIQSSTGFTVCRWRTLEEGSRDAHCGNNQERCGAQLTGCYIGARSSLGRAAFANVECNLKNFTTWMFDGHVYKYITMIKWHWGWRYKLLME